MAEKQFQVDEEGILTFSASPNPPLFFEPLQSCGISSSTPPNGLQTVSICSPSKGRPAVGALTRQCLSCFFFVGHCISHLANLLEKDYCQGFGIWSCPTHVAQFPSVFPPAASLFADGRNKERNEHKVTLDLSTFWDGPILKGCWSCNITSLLTNCWCAEKLFFNFKKNDSIAFLFFKSKSSICSEQHLKGLSEALKTCNVSSNEHTQEEQLFLHGAGVFCPHLY